MSMATAFQIDLAARAAETSTGVATCPQVSRPDGGHDTVVIKLISEDPSNYSDAPREGIRRVLEQCTGAAQGKARARP